MKIDCIACWVGVLQQHFAAAWHGGETLPMRLGQVLLVLSPFSLIAGSGVADIVLSLMGLLFLADSVQRRDFGWLKQRWVQVALVLWLYLVVRSLFTLEVEKSLGRSGPWIRFPLMAVAMAAWLARDRMQGGNLAAKLLTSLTVTVCFLTLDVIVQYFVGVDVFGRPSIPQPDGSLRLTGTFSAPKAGIVLVWLMFPVLAVMLGQAMGDKRALAKAVGWSALAMLAIFMTGERMALLLAGFGFVLLVLLRPALLRRLLPLGVITALAAALLMALNPALFERQVASLLEVLAHLGDTQYGMLWKAAATMVAESPVFGVGLRQFRLVCPEVLANPAYDMTGLVCNLHPHHFYLEWAAEAGLLGLALFLGLASLWLSAFWRAGRAMHRSGVLDMLFVGLVVALLLRLWPLSTAVSFQVAWSAAPFWFVVGWLLSYSQSLKSSDKL